LSPASGRATSTTSIRVAALNDVHGNLPALEAVLAEARDVDLIVFGGDVAAGMLPRETLDLLMSLENARFVQGNADRAMVEMFDGTRELEPEGVADEWAISQLDRARRDFLSSFEPTVSVDGVLFCHATPHDDETIFTRITPDETVRELLGDVDERVVVCGHTHMQFDRTVDGIRVANAGSVGMPYGTTDACWAVVENGNVELRRTPYDLEAAAERLRASGLKLRDVLIEENVLASPSEDEVIEIFERRAGR
jgi:putative phosphoesterase